MRDPKRIKPLLKALEEVWLANPDLRLGQMIASAANDPFYIEDKILIDKIKKLFEEGEDENKKLIVS